MTVTFPYALLAGPDGASALAGRGFTFPLLLRTPGFHGGQRFVQAESAAVLPKRLAELRGFGGATAEVIAIEYLDARGADNWVRKYRVMMVGGKLYPLHLAISKQWKIHYFSADMRDHAEHRAEEAKFLADMARVLGARAMTALERLSAAIALDYGGIDFGLNQDGDILLIEANATMVVEQPDGDPCWDYRRGSGGANPCGGTRSTADQCRGEANVVVRFLAAHQAKPPMNMVVRTSDGAVSLLVDEIGDVLEMDTATYERPPENLHPVARELIRGVYKLSGRLLLVLDAERTAELIGLQSGG